VVARRGACEDLPRLVPLRLDDSDDTDSTEAA
jgi:hypothetical protein